MKRKGQPIILSGGGNRGPGRRGQLPPRWRCQCIAIEVECMYIDMSFGVVSQVDHWMTFLMVEVGILQQERAIFDGGGIGQHNVGLAYRKNVALQWM